MTLDLLLMQLLAVLLTGAAQVEDQPPTTGTDKLPLDAPPIPIKVAIPDYPRNAIRRELNGRTVTCFNVDEGGRIRNPQVVLSSDKLFSKVSLKAIRQSTFKPARRGPDSVAADFCRSFRFDLELRQ